MSSNLSKSRVFPTTWLGCLILVVLVLGIFFRFVNLDRKIYWLDEAYTSLRISGYTEAEVARELTQVPDIGAKDLLKYQRINPEKSVADTIRGLAKEEPQLTPLYFTIARFWSQLFGSSVATARASAAVISLLAFPCIYWLCLELFASPLIGGVAVALIAVSPFNVLYAQEARQYSLWTVTILLSCAALLRAMRVKTKISWGFYAVTVALGLYSHFLFILVAAGHGLYLFVTERMKFSNTVKAYLLSSLAGFIAFFPWVVIVITNFNQVLAMTPTHNVTTRPSLFFLTKNWAGNISRNFVDFGFSSDNPLSAPLINLIPLILSIFIILILVSYSLYFLYRQTPVRVWLFILILMGFIALALTIPDIMIGGRRSTLIRYQIPFHLGIHLAVSYLLGFQISSILTNIRQQKFWQLVFILLISSGIVSCAMNAEAVIWWNKRTNQYNPQLSAIINQSNRPLIITEVSSHPPRYNVFNMVSLSYWLTPSVRFQFIPKDTLPSLTNSFRDIFLPGSSDKLRKRIETKYNVKTEPIYRGAGLVTYQVVGLPQPDLKP
jgi:uncharacterized membrane protein